MNYYHHRNLTSRAPVFDRPLMNLRQMFSPTISRVCFLFSIILTDTRFLHRYSMKGGKERESGEREKKSGGTSLPLPLQPCPLSFRILYRAIRPRRGPDKQEPLDWKQLRGIRKVCVAGLGSDAWTCLCQCMYMCVFVYVFGVEL